MSDGPWDVALSRAAQRDMRRLDRPIRERTERALRELATDPHRSGALRKLTAAPESRLRIGDWGALIALDGKTRTINVVRILPRGRVYHR